MILVASAFVLLRFTGRIDPEGYDLAVVGLERLVVAFGPRPELLTQLDDLRSWPQPEGSPVTGSPRGDPAHPAGGPAIERDHPTRDRRTRDRSRRGLWSGLWRDAAAAGLVFGAGAFAVAAVFMGLDYFAVRGLPTEHAVVTSVGPSGTQEACGPRAVFPNTPGERTAYRSDDPPPGLPAEFSITHCPDGLDRPGDMVEVRRTGPDQDEIYLDPIDGVGDWLSMAAAAGVLAGLVAAAWSCLGTLWGAATGR